MRQMTQGMGRREKERITYIEAVDEVADSGGIAGEVLWSRHDCGLGLSSGSGG